MALRKAAIFLLCALLGCAGRAPEPVLPPASPPLRAALPEESVAASPLPARDAVDPASPSRYGTLDGWHVAPDFDAFHARQLEAVAYAGAPSRRGGINPYFADALRAEGATWGLVYGEMTVLLPGGEAFGDVRQVHSAVKERRGRAWTAMERELYAVLEAGAVTQARKDGGTIYLAGALRNGAACQACHDEEAKEALLGAYVYPLREIADD
ncbi:MAG: hypothetical protein HYV27_18740 [Candidatus Hydrogenedentes bacterium]|nr:hypothetical protein [Candidatus Hydrogenedentota bacterium]